MSKEMLPENQMDALLPFFKALADPNRLKILGLLAKERLSVEELAETLKLSPSTVSHHLSRLAEAGLVSARAESYYNVYQLESGALEEIARSLLSKDTLPSIADDLDMDAYDRKVVRNYLQPDGSLKEIPGQRKKLESVLRHIVNDFEPGRHYTEKEVNKILARYHADTATLRRELIVYRLMARHSAGGEYWRL